MSISIRLVISAILAMLILFTGAAFAEPVEVLWLGHATTRITSTTGKVIVIDPFLKKNPKTPEKYKDLKALGKVDLILVTHGHIDHVADLIELVSSTGATVVANYELASQLIAFGILDVKKTIYMNKGGSVAPLGRGIQIHMVPAEHSSAIDLRVFSPPDLNAKKMRHLDAGAAVGYVVELENGFTIYHSGDTAVFGDMALINRFYEPGSRGSRVRGTRADQAEASDSDPLRDLPENQSNAGRVQSGARGHTDQDAGGRARESGNVLRVRGGVRSTQSGIPAFRRPSAKRTASACDLKGYQKAMLRMLARFHQPALCTCSKTLAASSLRPR